MSAGRDAEIKVVAFNFNRYDLISGKVKRISPDAITHDKPPEKNGEPGKQQNEADDDSSEPSGQELVYAARVSLSRTHM
jgi:hemolysin D